MFMRKVLSGLCLMGAVTVQAEIATPHLGQPASKALLNAWNNDIFPDGTGLPLGQGSAAQGKTVYQQYCQSCHGADGKGGAADELAGAVHGLTDNPPDKTIGTYWPYATTIFDFTRRTMPLDRPGILSHDQLYAVTAYLLYLNDLLKLEAVIDAKTLADIKMPNREGFIKSEHN